MKNNRTSAAGGAIPKIAFLVTPSPRDPRKKYQRTSATSPKPALINATSPSSPDIGRDTATPVPLEQLFIAPGFIITGRHCASGLLKRKKTGTPEGIPAVQFRRGYPAGSKKIPLRTAFGPACLVKR